MFTGIVEEIGTVERREPRPTGNLVRLYVRAGTVLEDARLGDSIAHNGVCLTISDLQPGFYGADVMAETLRRTTLGSLRRGDPVNLERALGVGGRFGGHFVQGHVEGVGTIAGIQRTADWVTYEIEAPQEVLRYVVPKGSITVDGVSLTVVDRPTGGFTISLIPHTLSVTTLGRRQVGDQVNLEPDILAKYVEAALGRRDDSSGTGSRLTFDWLAEQGYGPEAG